MVQITIDDGLAEAIAKAGQFFTLVDSRGNTIAEATRVESGEPVPIGMTPEHIAELERRMREDDGTRFTWDEVKEHLLKLSE